MFKLVIPVLMGLESVVASELLALGYTQEQIEVSNALVKLLPEQTDDAIKRAIARCNLFLRTAERIELEVASFEARSFDELFDQVKCLPWNDLIPEGAAILVKGYSRKSVLFAPSAIQGSIKKAVIESLQKARFLRGSIQIAEDREIFEFRIQYAILEDKVSIRVDTTGEGLHKRGYRRAHNAAPIKETLAAGIILLSRWEPFSGELLYDPFCGSGTFLTEAALIAASIAPGVSRSFAAEQWFFVGRIPFIKAREEALSRERRQAPETAVIAGSDIDRHVLTLAQENARRADIKPFIKMTQADVSSLKAVQLKRVLGSDKILFVGNPPYGERMEELKTVARLNNALAKLALEEKQNYCREGCRLSVITAADFENDTGHKADKRRKLYNGMIKCTMYHYFRTEKRKRDGGNGGS